MHTLSEVVIDIAGQEGAAVITTSSVDRLELQDGQPVMAVIKATEVMFANVYRVAGEEATDSCTPFAGSAWTWP